MFDYEFFLTFLAAPALQTAKETPRIAFAPNLPEKKKQHNTIPLQQL